ncbi:cell cycle control protein [Anaeramoeba flamelloides]|uniref:Cell cycle control protein n=1 Tax=Anaeramoeba flamelloides TaxID=1746091 RepID=A0ABQ8X6R9_9EUKA|nr:cell cycle control protein [Anaeramoeba flamelloides]
MSQHFKPSHSKFKQQKLRTNKLILSGKNISITFIVVGVLFLIFGLTILGSSDGVIEIVKQYDNKCETGKDCSIEIKPTQTMKAPIYLYYELTNLHQNHRRYLKSKSNDQLKGEDVTYEDVSKCNPVISLDKKENDKDIYQPCGLIPWSKFNDTFSIIDSNNDDLGFTSKGIAWQTDIDGKFKNPKKEIDPNASTTIQSDFTDENFIVWMRPAAFPKFRKLFSILKKGSLEKDKTYTVNIQNNYPVKSFEGTKKMIFTTISWAGGKNRFLGLLYVIVSIFLLVVGTAILIKHLSRGREFGDTAYLKW